jgi:hypothetical protein
VCEEQARLPLGLLPDSETNARLYIQETGKVRLYIGPAHASPKPPLGYIASLYAHTLRICKPLMFSTNHRSTRAYARRMLMREEQRIGPAPPSTGSNRRVSISPACIWHTLTMCTARPDPAGRPRGVPLAVHPPPKG